MKKITIKTLIIYSFLSIKTYKIHITSDRQFSLICDSIDAGPSETYYYITPSKRSVDGFSQCALPLIHNNDRWQRQEMLANAKIFVRFDTPLASVTFSLQQIRVKIPNNVRNNFPKMVKSSTPHLLDVQVQLWRVELKGSEYRMVSLY